MNSFTFALSNIVHKFSRSILNILILASGITIIISIFILNAQLKNEFEKNLKNIDLVIGAKGSPMQLIMSSVFHIDIPTGNIPLEKYEEFKSNPLIKNVIPIALGDNYKGFRIVGTETSYITNYDAKIIAGKIFSNSMETVIGADVAKRTNLKIGDKITGSHGLSGSEEKHEATPYIIVGILEKNNSILDKLVLTPISSVWHVHEEHHDEAWQSHDAGQTPDEHKEEHWNEDKQITSLLISYKSPIAAVTLPRYINENTSIQSASPAFEVARLNKFMGTGINALKSVGIFLLGLSFLGNLISLYNSINERKYELALLRSMGASPRKIFSIILSESLVISILGLLIGIVAGHISVALIADILEKNNKAEITGWIFVKEEILAIIATFVIAIIASSFPSIKLYKIDIFKTLVQK